MISLGGWKAALAAGGIALLLAGWGLYERRTAQLEAERRERAEALAETLQRALMASEAEAAKQREVAQAADRAVAALIAERDARRPRIATVVREVHLAPDAQSPVCPAIGLALDRLRGIDARAGDPDAGRAAGAPASPPGRSPAPGRTARAGEQRAGR